MDHPYADRYRRTRRRFFRRRRRPAALATDVAPMVALSLGFAALTGVAAQVRVPLPFSPVPVTGQTFAVLLSGGDSRLAVRRAEPGALRDPRRGRGAVVRRRRRWRRGPVRRDGRLRTRLRRRGGAGRLRDGLRPAAAAVRYLVVLLAVVNFGVIHLLGATQLGLFYWLVQGSPQGPVTLLVDGVLPFVPGDLAKLVLVAGLGTAVVPHGSLDGDAGTPAA